MRERLIQRWYSDAPPPLPLRPLAALFGAVAALRRRWLRRRAPRLPVPVIVVGNITVGGAGKTPFVIWLVERLREWGWRPGVVSRGYGGRGGQWPRRVAADSDPAQVGDEPVLMAQRLRCPLAVGPDRVAAARRLLDGGAVDVIVADDGLQHYRLHRDLEIAVVDGARGVGNGALLPAGPLREPPGRLAEVALVVVNGGGWRLAGTAPADMHLLADVAERLDGSARRELAAFEGQVVHAVAGIGNPQRFFAKLESLGIRVIPHGYPDHHAYAAADLDFGDDKPVLMTEKDAVKCRRFARPQHWYVPVEAVLSAADTAAVQKLTAELRDRK
ncbi:MAG: tetraacyldisaccharide 4'-kinase [Gammaproteobacteria bacterium]|nr:tetraacyldisaccharide 4'-kinase [Gammaproteobacteria bacterium]